MNTEKDIANAIDEIFEEPEFSTKDFVKLCLTADKIDERGANAKDTFPVDIEAFFTFAFQRNLAVIEQTIKEMDLDNLDMSEFLSAMSFATIASMTDGFAIGLEIANVSEEEVESAINKPEDTEE